MRSMLSAQRQVELKQRAESFDAEQPGSQLLWAAVFTFNPYLLISINELLISIIHLLISINELLISINELLISINTLSLTVFIDIYN